MFSVSASASVSPPAVVKQCVSTEGVDAAYVKEMILPEFFRNFWVRRMALDRRNYRQLVETTEEIANSVGCAEVTCSISLSLTLFLSYPLPLLASLSLSLTCLSYPLSYLPLLTLFSCLRL